MKTDEYKKMASALRIVLNEGRNYKVPLVEGSLSNSFSFLETAILMALAKALKIASIL